MPRQYQIRDNDTLQRIAQRFLGDAAAWQTLAAFNGLDYPFLTSDPDFQKEIPASGIVRFSFNPPPLEDKKIPAGFVVKVPGTTREYLTKFDAVCPAGNAFVEVLAVCRFAGIWGNTSINSITEIVNPDPKWQELDDSYAAGRGLVVEEILPAPTTVTVTNPLPFTNGVIYNIKKTGDFILLPDNLSAIDSTASVLQEDFGGKDLMLFDDGELGADLYGDITSVNNVQNIAYAAKHRLETERGELLLHPDYGSRLHQLIGRTEPFVQKMMELEVTEVLLQDSRIKEVQMTSVTKVGQTLEIAAQVVLTGNESTATLQFSLFAEGR